MRDLHKVKEQEGLLLTSPQVYVLLGLLTLSLGMVFFAGYHVGRRSSPVAVAAIPPLLPPEVQSESVALLLARAAEDEAETLDKERVELQFHDILPARDAQNQEAFEVRQEVQPEAELAALDAARAAEEKAAKEAPGAEGEGAREGTEGGGAAGQAGAGEAKGVAEQGTEGGAARADAVASSRDEASGTPAKTADRGKASEGGAESTLAKADGKGQSRPDEKVASKTSDKASTAKAQAEKVAAEKAAAEKAAADKAASEKVAAQKAAAEKEKALAAKAQTEKASAKAADKGVSSLVAKASPKPERAPTPMPAPTAPPKKEGKDDFTVQVSSYQDASVADKLVRQLSAQGFSAYKVAAEVNGHTWYRVRVGSFGDRTGAERELQRLKAARSELNPMIAHR